MFLYRDLKPFLTFQPAIGKLQHEIHPKERRRAFYVQFSIGTCFTYPSGRVSAQQLSQFFRLNITATGAPNPVAFLFNP